MEKDLSIKILQRVLDYLNMNPKQLSDKIGKDRPQWAYDVLNPNKKVGISKDISERICNAFPDISRSWLLTGEGEMLSSSECITIPIFDSKTTEVTETLSTITLYDIEAAANLKTLFANKDQNILGQISIPNIPKCDGAVYVKGDSMYPLLKSGDIVAYKEIPVDLQHIFFGEMYLVSIDFDGDEYLAVKYVQRSERGEEWIRLASYNPHHEPKDFPLSCVRALALVKLSIRMNTMK